MLDDQLGGGWPEWIACSRFVEGCIGVRNQFRIGRARNVGIASQVDGVRRPPGRRVFMGARPQQNMVGFAARPLGQPGNVAMDYAFHIEKSYCIGERMRERWRRGY
jgi:hypothetical protein